MENDELLARARQAAENAYCPYSGFPVGAALETDLGLFTGCNVENASYGLTLCAERVALFSAVAAGAKRFHRLAVVCVKVDPGGPSNGRMPCGACRQVMAEFMPSDALIVVDRAGDWKLSELLPAAFHLGKAAGASDL